MQIKKLLKYLPITVIAAGLVVTASAPSLSLLNNSDYVKNQLLNSEQEVDETEYTDQLDYIRNDVAKQAGVTNSVASIKLSSSSSRSRCSAALVTKNDGSTLLYMWGSNQYGQLGNGSVVTNASTPTPVDSKPFGGKKIIQIAIGAIHSAALLDDGSLYMWGANSAGQLGNGTSGSWANKSTPTPVDSKPFGGKKIIQVALGDEHSAALLEDGSLYTWGLNDYGQLGNGNSGLGARTSIPTPVDSKPFGANKIIQIELGQYHSAALLDDGSLYMWGENDWGQLGNTTNSGTYNPSPTPTLVTALSGKKITQIALGKSHSAAIVTGTDGLDLLYMWGKNYYGQLGNTTNSGTHDPTPTPILNPLSGRKITQIALGSVHSAALLADGSLYMWGLNQCGQLGSTANIADETPNPVPTKVNGPTGPTGFGSRKITQITLGLYHSTALLDDDSLYMWGENDHGQLGFTANWTPNPIPTWMSQLGKDSHITAKSATAKNAVDNLWVDNKFNLAGFKNSFDLVNIPDVADQTFGIDTKPTYNNRAGTVTMNIKIKYYYDENGLIVANTAATPMIIIGFIPGPNIVTNITVKWAPLSSIVVDKWSSYVTVDGKINRTKLEEFLTLTGVPADAVFTITNSNPNNKTGGLTFNITSSKTMDDQGRVLNTPSDPFPITLNLTPRVTKMTPKTSGYPADLTPTALKAKLVDNNGLVKDINELNKYLTIVAPVDGVQYHLVDNKWDANGSDGTVNFAIYASKYYDTDATEQTGSGTIAASKVVFSLTLQREVSTIAVKATMPNVRVDKFETYVKSNGTTIATSKLGEFFDLTNIPSGATFSIDNVKIDAFDANFTHNHLTFDLTINQFNQGSPATPSTYTHNYGLTLGVQNQPTVIKAKSAYNQSIRVDKVANELNALSGPALVDYLNNYLDIQSIPDGATITLGNIAPVDATGILTFNVIPSQIYNANSELDTPTANQFNVTLQFGIKHVPTSIAINADHTKTRVDQFANNVNTLKGQDLYAYLVPNYVNAVSVDGTKLTAEVISQDNASGKITIKLSVSQYYDGNSNLVDGTLDVILDYVLSPAYAPTNITINSSYINTRIDQFANNVNTLKGQDLYAYLVPSYVNAVSVDGTKLTAEVISQDNASGKITIKLSVSQYYDGNSNLVDGTLDVILDYVLSPAYAPTNITINSSYINTRIDQFANNVNTLKGQDLYAYLVPNYVNAISVDGTKLTAEVISQDNASGKITIKLSVSQYYDGNSNLVDGTLDVILDYVLSPLYAAPTSITINSSYVKTRINQFANNVNTLKGQDLYAYLVPNYVNAISVDGTKLTAEVISQDNASGKITIKLSVSQYYDGNSNLVDGILEATLDFELTPVYTTNIKTLPASVYPQDLTPDQFKQRLETGGAEVVGERYTLSPTNIAFIKKFLVIESVPDDAVYTLTFAPTTYNAVNTPFSFNLTIDKHYDANGDLINISRTYNELSLKLLDADQPIKPKTEITVKPEVEVVVETPTDFLDSIVDVDGTYKLAELSKYIDGLNTIPSDSSITIIQDGVNADGTAYFTLKVSGYYDGETAEYLPDGEYKFTVKTKQVTVTASEETFQWWWILVGVGAAGVGAWFAIKKYKPNWFKNITKKSK